MYGWISNWIDSVQFSLVQLFATPWTAACQASLSITNFRSLLRLMSIESVMPSNHLILWSFQKQSIQMRSLTVCLVTQSCPTLCDPMDCITPGFPVHHQLPELVQTHVLWVGDAIQPSHPLSSPSPPSFSLSSIRVFSNESVLHIRWLKYWSFSYCISPSNEYSGLISFRMDWLDLLAVQDTLKSLLQHHSSKASILRHSAFFIVQLSHPSTHDYWKNHGFD